MAKVRTTGTTYKCDNCGNTQFVAKGDSEPPLGITLKGHFDLGSGGGPIPEAFACQIDCIEGAVVAVMYQ